ncbi:P-loop containing nucleoside triphosphate hydrolase protein [Lineolata rhizophorae]|uniref:P-loop containing nucleoside triphosphate hydrolase protein n=1 Tax=Lineolata rhizophorae TaxID=578093 RepID=A0A6A6P5S5_9PEZI|nr:P-loop containing nucleoside triphosphate hydrolase protein [Lineolata rhizophorae]
MGLGGKRARGKKQNSWIRSVENEALLPSAKTLCIKAQLLNWFAERPGLKVIVYSQFIDMLKILERICGVEGWGSVMYYGGMSLDSRNKAIEEFALDERKKVMLASLKSGGIGLNLTMASKVIIVDPWWNFSMDQQAFCRVFRRGQEQKTEMTRFVVEDTIDTDIIWMQKQKQTEINQVMAEPKERTVMDLMKLFGPVGEDEAGNHFIITEDKD